MTFYDIRWCYSRRYFIILDLSLSEVDQDKRTQYKKCCGGARTILKSASCSGSVFVSTPCYHSYPSLPKTNLHTPPPVQFQGGMMQCKNKKNTTSSLLQCTVNMHVWESFNIAFNIAAISPMG